MVKIIDIWTTRLEKLDSRLPHGSNLCTKSKKKKKSLKDIKTLLSILPKYFEFRQVLSRQSNNLSNWINSSVDALEKYYTILKLPSNRIFPHQSDLLSSVVPEFFYDLLNKSISEIKVLQAETQKQIVIECSFIPLSEIPIFLKMKRVDVAILSPAKMTIHGNEIKDFSIPLVALEIKTNLDKNMISGIEHSVESLKKTFPLCQFFVVSEFADFAVEKQNYASTYIDEIYILRKQKRSNFRKTSNIESIDKDLCLEIVSNVTNHIIKVTKDNLDLKRRMELGKLIRN